jgi:hypothetical protein
VARRVGKVQVECKVLFSKNPTSKHLT